MGDEALYIGAALNGLASGLSEGIKERRANQEKKDLIQSKMLEQQQQQKAQLAEKLRDDRNNSLSVKALQGATDSYNNIQTLDFSKTPNIADNTLVYAYTRMLTGNNAISTGDAPGAMASLANGDFNVPGLKNALENLSTGGNLAPDQRIGFIDAATQIYKNRLANQNVNDDYYRQIAIQNGIDPSHIIAPYGVTLGPDVGPKGIYTKGNPQKQQAALEGVVKKGGEAAMSLVGAVVKPVGEYLNMEMGGKISPEQQKRYEAMKANLPKRAPNRDEQMGPPQPQNLFNSIFNPKK